MTFLEVSKSLKKEWADRFSKEELAEKTLIWLNALNQKFGTRILYDISAQEIEDYRDNIASEKSNVSANKYLSIIKKVFKHGRELNAVFKDPSDGIRALNEKQYVRNRFLSAHEIEKLIEAAKQTRAKFYLPAIIYLGVEHGASKQEIFDLKWSKIDFDYKGKGLITLDRTKTKRQRTDFIMPRIKQALLDWFDHLT